MKMTLFNLKVYNVFQEYNLNYIFSITRDLMFKGLLSIYQNDLVIIHWWVLIVHIMPGSMYCQTLSIMQHKNML